MNKITVVNIVRGSGGVPRSFVQDCLSSKRVFTRKKSTENWLIFRADVFTKVFSEVYGCEGFSIMKVEFKVVLVCWFLILSIFIFDQGEHNEKTV